MKRSKFLKLSASLIIISGISNWAFGSLFNSQKKKKMKLQIKTKQQQHGVSLFGGKLNENKPLSGEPLYSNLIYWANVEAVEEGTFPMHPHEGIEILTFVFKGELEHFDTATNKWTPLPADAVQHIQAGSGLQHSEKYWKGSRAFQIWFDPNFSTALTKTPYYKDYQADAFNWKNEHGYEVKSYVGENAPIQTDAPGITAKRYKLPIGNHTLTLDLNSFHSFYLMEGRIELEGNTMSKDSFTKTSGLSTLNVNASEPSELFVLESPITVDYKKVTDR